MALAFWALLYGGNLGAGRFIVVEIHGGRQAKLGAADFELGDFGLEPPGCTCCSSSDGRWFRRRLGLSARVTLLRLTLTD